MPPPRALWLAIATTLLACRAPATRGQTGSGTSSAAAPATDRAAPGVAAPPTAPSSTPTAGAAVAATAPAEAPGAGCPDPVAHFARARKASGEGRWGDAIDEFDLAIRARPVDARLRAERGFAYLKSGDARRARQDFYDALALTRDPRLRAEAWYNVAQAAKALGDDEGARIALVLAERHGSKAATARLGTDSRCVATWRVAPEGEVPIARGWTELAAARLLVNCSLPLLDPAAPPSARERSCHGCGYGDRDEGDQCTGDPPWAIASGNMHFHTHTFFVAPLPGGAFYYQNAVDAPTPPAYRIEGDWLVIENGHAEAGVSLSFAGGNDLVYGRFRGDDEFVDSDGEWSGAMEDDGTSIADAGATCRPDLRGEVELPSANAAQMAGTPMIPDHPGPRRLTWISIAQRRAVFELAAHAADVSARLTGGRAEIRGGGCQADVPLTPDR